MTNKKPRTSPPFGDRPPNALEANAKNINAKVIQPKIRNNTINPKIAMIVLKMKGLILNDAR
jgi:hypothetical protein